MQSIHSDPNYFIVCQELTENKDDFQKSNLLSKILCCSEVWPLKHTLFVPTLQPDVIPVSALVAHALQFHRLYFFILFFRVLSKTLL